MQDNNRFVVQADNSKADEAAGSMMGWAMLLSIALVVLVYVYQVLEGWYNAAVLWVTETGNYLAGFWPF